MGFFSWKIHAAKQARETIGKYVELYLDAKEKVKVLSYYKSKDKKFYYSFVTYSLH